MPRKFAYIPFLIFLTLCPALPAAGPAVAARLRLALIPISDLSINYNGIDLETTQQFEQILKQFGYEPAVEKEVRKFMAANRVFDCSRLNAFTARKLGRELDCELILGATITDISTNDRKPDFGLALNIFSAASGEIVWSLHESSARTEETTLLAIGEPRSQVELKQRILIRLATRLQKLTSGNPPPGNRTTGKPYEIEEFLVKPSYARSGTPVETTIRIDTLDSPPDRVTVITGPDRELILKPGRRPGEFGGRWSAPALEGRHPLSLRLIWKRTDKQLVYIEKQLASYQVCNTPPRLSVEFRQAREMDGIPVFNKQVVLISHYSHKVPISRWQVQVTNRKNTSIFKETYSGRLPNRMAWRGWDSRHNLLPDGRYIFTLRIWDAAGNQAEVSRTIAIQRKCPPLTVKTIRKERQIFLQIEDPAQTGKTMLQAWHLNLYSPTGNEILSRSGTELPAEIELPQGYKSNFVRCELEARDQIGNLFTLSDERIYMPGHDLDVARQKTRKKWSEDF